ncbi:MAG: 4-hydroxy-tetrahydrodipicolinate synthase [Candidatus Heteroscillospira sp.]|jgi:4-hydroxy-tetrahydrodipicolinate synthase
MSFCPKGILPAMITPMTKDYKVNIPALRKLINYMIDGGVHGIFAIGTTGEFYALSKDEYREVLEVTVDEVAGRVPVYAGCNGLGTRESIELTKIASEVGGIDAISVLTPYFISLSQNEVYNHFKTIAENTDMNIILYDNAPKTHITIKPATVAKLADIPNIVGMKDSTGDLTNTADIIGRTTRAGKDFHVMMGRDSLIHAALCYGATGAVAAAANVAPKLCSDIYNKYMAGDIKGSLEDQYNLVPLRVAFGLGSFPTVIKEALELVGIEAGPCAMPVGVMTDEEKAELRKILTGMGLIG